MNFFRSIFLLVVLVFFKTGCRGPVDQKGFTQEELNWLVYDKGDEFFFQSEDGQIIDTLLITQLTDLEKQKSIWPLEAEIEISRKGHKEAFKIYLLKNDRLFKRYLRVDDVYRSLDLLEPIDSVIFGTKVFRDVYIVSEDSSNIAGEIWRIYFSKTEGIIRYDSKTHTFFKTLL